jgi:hypothetical protein
MGADGLSKASLFLRLPGQIFKLLIVLIVLGGAWWIYRALSPPTALVCPPNTRASGDPLHVICYENCPDGYKSDGANRCYKPCPADWPGADTLAFCEHKTIYSTVGADPSLSIPSTCLSGKISYLSLCYDVPAGWQVTAPGFIGKVCDPGWRDDGTSCWQDLNDYGRGFGYTSEDKCTSDSGGNCEKFLLLWYPVCRPGYHAVGSNICERSPERVSKEVRSQIGTLPDGCPPGRELHGRLCYPGCPAGYERRADDLENCSSVCPPGFANIGIGGCQKPSSDVSMKGLAEVGVCPPDAPVKKGLLCYKR